MFDKLINFFSDESKWMKGHYYGNEKKEVCPEREATRYCLLGAIAILYDNNDESDRVCNSLRGVIRARGYNMISTFNDSEKTSFDDILSVIKECEESYES